jgi:TP901 family phage tail tape measure protein
MDLQKGKSAISRWASTSTKEVGKVNSAFRTKLSGGIGKASASLKTFAAGAPGLIMGVTKAVMGLTAVVTVATGAITALVIKGVKDLGKFQHGMAEVSTLISDDVDAWTTKLSDGVRELSLDVPHNTATLTKALYDTISAGVDVSEAMNMLGSSSRAAVAGVSDVTSATRLATSTINALGMEFSETDKVFDTAFSTVKYGVITFSELADSLGMVLPSASKVNASVEDVYGSIAFLTKMGQNGERATTALARAFDGLGEKADKLKTIGVDVFGETGDYLPILNIIEQLGEAMEGLNEQAKTNLLVELGFEQRAARFIIPAINNLETYRQTMQDVADSAGATITAFDRMKNTLVNQWTGLKNSFAELGRTVGEGFAGMASAGITQTKDMVDNISRIISDSGGINSLWENHRELVIATFKDISMAGVTLTAEMLKGMASMVGSAARVMWIPLKAGFHIAMLEALEELPDILTPTMVAQKLPFVGEKIGDAYDKIWAGVKERTQKAQDEIWSGAMDQAGATIDAELPNIIAKLGEIGTAVGTNFTKASTAIDNLAKGVGATADKTVETTTITETEAPKQSTAWESIIPSVGSLRFEVDALKTDITGVSSAAETAALNISRALTGFVPKGFQAAKLENFLKTWKPLKLFTSTVTDKPSPTLLAARKARVAAIDEELKEELALIGEQNAAAERLYITGAENAIEAAEKGADEKKEVNEKYYDMLEAEQQAQAVREKEWLEESTRNWKNMIRDIKTAFSNLFQDILDPEVKNKFELFWKDLAAIGRREIANMVAGQLFDFRSNGINIGVTGGSGGGFKFGGGGLGFSAGVPATKPGVAYTEPIGPTPGGEPMPSEPVPTTGSDVAGALAAIPYIWDMTGLIKGGGGRHEVGSEGELHPSFKAALLTGQSAETVARLEAELRKRQGEINREFGAWVQNQEQNRQAAWEAAQEAAEPTTEEEPGLVEGYIGLAPGRNASTQRVMEEYYRTPASTAGGIQPAAGTQPTIPARVSEVTFSGDVNVNITLPEGAEVDEEDIAAKTRMGVLKALKELVRTGDLNEAFVS